MKKYFSMLLLAIFGLVALSCVDRTNDTPVQDNDTYSVAYDLKGINFVKSSNSNSLYGFNKSFASPLYNSDVVLIYRQDGTSSNGNPIWRMLPTTYYLTQGDLDYKFDFSKSDIQLYANGNFDLSAQNADFFTQYLNNQTFRVVLVPASFGNKNANVDYSDYYKVIQYFNIDDTNVKTL